MKKKPDFKLASLVVPLTAAAVCSGVFFYENKRYQSGATELEAVQKQYSKLVSLLKEMEGKKDDGRIPLVAQTVREQPIFLNSLRQYADLNHVQLMKWSAAPNAVNPVAAAAAAKAKENSNEPPKPKALMDDVTTIANVVEVGGSYANVRSFLYDVSRFPRLVTMNDAKYSRTQGTTTPSLKVAFTLARYVAPVGKAPDDISVAATQPAPSGIPTSSPFNGGTNDTKANINGIDSLHKAVTNPGSASQIFRSGAMYQPHGNEMAEKLLSAGSPTQSKGTPIAPTPVKR